MKQKILKCTNDFLLKCDLNGKKKFFIDRIIKDYILLQNENTIP